jgi:hypothetical protein
MKNYYPRISQDYADFKSDVKSEIEAQRKSAFGGQIQNTNDQNSKPSF